MYGGDFAGHSATFSSKTGALIPVPEHYLPQSLIEWDRIPTSFEVITSEDLDEGGFSIRRNGVTVIPEVGCGVDNLDTLASSQDFLHKDVKLCRTLESSITIGAIAKQLKLQQTSQLETTFSTRSNRLRVSLDLNRESCLITSPIRITLERQTSQESTRGKIAQGGGLDGRTVANLIGKDLYNPPFSDASPLTMDFIQKYMPPDSIANKTILSLPPNIILGYGQMEKNYWEIQVSRWVTAENHIEQTTVLWCIPTSTHGKEEVTVHQAIVSKI
jgi:hypothetical protein